MAFDFAALKARVRQSVHDVFSVPGLYSHTDLAEPVAVTVRWHNKIERFGDLVNTGYPEVIEGVDRLIFNIPELKRLNLTPAEGGVVEITASEFGNPKFVLSEMEPQTGPVEEVWLVGHQTWQS